MENEQVMQFENGSTLTAAPDSSGQFESSGVGVLVVEAVDTPERTVELQVLDVARGVIPEKAPLTLAEEIAAHLALVSAGNVVSPGETMRLLRSAVSRLR